MLLKRLHFKAEVKNSLAFNQASYSRNYNVSTVQPLLMNTLVDNAALLFKNKRRSLVCWSIAIITVGLEELVGNVVFKCPCNGHLAYGLAFLWVPSLLLFLCGILVDVDLWRPVKKLSNKRFSRKLFKALKVFFGAALAPAAWLVLSFLKEQYYTCAFFGPPMDTDRSFPVASFNTTPNCYLELASRTRELEETYRIRSQMAGWSIMLVTMSALFILFIVNQCSTRRKKLRLPSVEYYRHIEAKEALEQFHAKAKQIAMEKAKQDIGLLFQNARLTDFLSGVKQVGAAVNRKYGAFFVIPPESPACRTPDAGEPP